MKEPDVANRHPMTVDEIPRSWGDQPGLNVLVRELFEQEAGIAWCLEDERAHRLVAQNRSAPFLYRIAWVERTGVSPDGVVLAEVTCPFCERLHEHRLEGAKSQREFGIVARPCEPRATGAYRIVDGGPRDLSHYYGILDAREDGV